MVQVADCPCHRGVGVTQCAVRVDWDTYRMADEYAAGKFYIVWDADTMHIMVGKLNVSGTAR